MMSPVRATAVVGLGSVVSLAASVVSAKILALVVGPDGVGLLGIMQSLLGMVGLVAGLGISTGVVRALAAAGARADDEEAAALRQAGEMAVLAAGVVAFGVLVLFRDAAATLVLGSQDRSGLLVVLAAAVPLTLLAGVELGIINGYHRLGALTLASIVNALVAQGVLIGLVVIWGEAGIAPALLIGSATSLLIASVIRGRAVGVATRLVSPARLRQVGTQLIRFGVPFTASALVGTGAQMLVPILVLNQLGQTDVGYYRAASTISVGYLAFLLTAFAQDYYPRIAAARPEDLLDLMERRLRLVMAIAVPIILGMLALAPLAIRILYSGAFLPGTNVLEWQLVGDLLKLPAWTMAFVILARGSSGRYFLVELVGGVTLVAVTWVATSWWGVAGAGIAYLASYAVYYPIVLLVVRRYAPATPGRLQVAALALVAVSIGLLALPEAFIVLRTAVFLGLAVGMAVLGWPRMWRLHRAGAL